MTVRIDVNGPVWTVILDRPHARNAVDGPTAAALADAFRAFDADPDARVAVLWGDGGTFCAGADLKALGPDQQNRIDPDGDGPMGPSRMQLSKPTIAAIDGHAVAGGLELACWCDLRVVAQSAILGVFCRRWGVPLIDGGTVRLPRIVGEGRALDLILTGRAVASDEALAIGLANRVVPDGSARAEAEALAHRIAAFPWSTVLADLAGGRAALDQPVASALRDEFTRGVASLGSPEVATAVGAFLAGAGRHGRSA
jgi:enoyl-CoA hydratase